jgi:UDP-3-O-[3-hydroxymyristoyl] glucosamine N-acyltransferase
VPSHATPSPISLQAIADLVNGRLVGAGLDHVTGVAGLQDARAHDLSYVSADRHIKSASASQAGAFVVHREIEELRRPQIVTSDPSYAFARIVQQFFVEVPQRRGVAQGVVTGEGVSIGEAPSIWPNVTLGDRVRLGHRVTLYPGVFLGDDVAIGDDTVLHPNVTVRERCRIGSRVIVHAGTVIGSDGFGYVQHEGCHYKIPQIGIVVIEDDVELGANVTVDRATFGQTVVKRGSKVDNLVQIAHNVTVGEHSILVAQVGVAGSTTLGHHVVLGGQVGITDHVTIGDGAMVAAKGGVTKDVPAGQVVSGYPALPHDQALRASVVFARLPELRRQLIDLEKKVDGLAGVVAQMKPARENSAARRPQRRGAKRSRQK